MKNFSHSINVDKDKNYVISHTESDWVAMRNNSLISIDDDSYFYTIGKIEPLNFINDFTIDNNTLILDGNFEHFFIKDDILTISYKEYELLTIKDIINQGRGYKNGDILSCSDGLLSINIFDNSKQPATFKVEEVDGNGAIIKLNILNKGNYIQSPAETSNSLAGGNGNSAVVSLGFIIINNRRMIDRQVLNARNDQSTTIIELSDNLPVGVTTGKISMNKYIGYLTSNYIGDTKRNAKYHVTRDKTPHLGLPFLSKNSQKNEEFFNHVILELDKKIKELENRLEKANL